MAEQKQKQKQKQEQKKAPKEQPKENMDVLVRIFGYDILGNKNIYVGLTKIKGISWTLSSFICHKLNLDKSKKVSELSKQEIQTIESFLEKMDLPDFLKNRRSDLETGISSHIYSNDLDMKKEFDIKRLKKIKSYKGIRHSLKLPVRGQKTRSHFRKREKVVGVKRSKK